MAEDQLVFSDDDVVIKQGAIPSIQFSDKVKSSLYRPWRSAVIIKLMGRPLAYTFLRSRLLQRWALKGPMSLIDLENNYFIVKFLYEEDMRYVLTGGPWQIAGQYIVAQKWKPGFNAKEEKITHMTAWVDDHTLSQARGKFARICVELDLAKPLTPFIEIEGRTYGVVYEGINLVCFECGCFGHGRDSCPIILQAKQQVPESDNADCMEDISTVQVNMNLGTATKEAEVPAKMHGEWMLLKPRNFRKNSMNDVGKGVELSKRNTKNTGTKAISPVFGSRFNVLTEEVGREEDMEGSPPVMTSDSRSKKQGSSANTYSTKAKCAGVKSASSRDSGTWVFKKPLKDISNSVVANSSGGGVKSAGAKSFSCHDIEPVGLQVKGSDVQDDVRGKFSFNLGGSIFPRLPLGKGGLFFGHEPPDISEMGINEVESSNACDMDHQGNFSEHCESDSGLEADSSFEHDGLEAVEAEHVQI
ncbi:PREDICTED: reverse mRNAase [Prunus dulcis]|uniref:PREDICTED: reverse mRNAase n=1 Tax=Prunus dulcis TaxID=3755 RepID=A0A5E4F9I3_PRUDU|nr:PREDICTED: reverse mRNAase [Prunus dulcis]